MIIPRTVATFLASLALLEGALSAEVQVPNGGFEAGLSRPWGTGQYSEGRPIWWTSGNCQSSANADRAIRKSGNLSLHIINRSPRAPNVFGSMQQQVRIVPNQRYRIIVWARAKGLTSDGAVSIVVDREWKVRPIRFPKGDYDWTRFTGEFSLPEGLAQLRILSEDKGEAWIDDIEITAVTGEELVAQSQPQASAPPKLSSQKSEPASPSGPLRYFAPAEWVRPISGELSFHEVDLSLPSGFALTRAYSTDPRLSADFGPGWVADWETGVIADGAEDRVDVLLPDLTLGSMRRGSDGAYRTAGSADELRRKPSGEWVLTLVAGGSITYDEKGRPVEIVSPDGAKLRYERKNGLLAKIVASDGTAFEIFRDGSGRIRQTKGKEISASYVYGQDGRLKEFRGSDGWFVQYETDNRGRVVKRVDTNNATTHMSYDASGKVEALGAPKNGLTPRLTFVYGPASFSVKDSDGQTKTLSAGPTAIMQDALGEKLTIKRDADGSIVQTVDPRGLRVDFLYDELGRPAGWSDSVGRGEKWRWDGTRLVEITDVLGRSRQYFYDALGNLATMVDPAGKRIEFSAVPEQRPWNAETMKGLAEISRATSFKSNGSREKVEIHGAGLRYDTTGRLTGMNDYRLEYGPGGQVSKIVGPGNESVSFDYDAAGRETAVISAAFGRKRFEYDAGDRLVKQYFESKDQPIEVRIENDPLNRIKSVTASQGAKSTFTYSKDGQTRDEVSGKFRRTVTANNTGQISLDKDTTGRSVEFAYDQTGAPNGWRASDGWQLATTRSSTGEITNLNFSGPGNRGLSVTLARKASEVVTSYSNGVSATSQLDASGRPTEIKWSSKKGTLATRTYTYEKTNRLIKEQRTDFIDNGPVSSQREFKYDAAGRLIEQPTTRPRHDYDSAGRVAKLQAADRTVRFRWDGADQLLGAEVTTEAPHSVQEFSLERDAVGSLVAKSTLNTTTQIWRAAGVIQEIEERSGSKVSTTRFLPGPKGDPIAFVFNDHIYVLMTTPRGDVIGVADEEGAMVNHYDYDDWGAMLVESEKIPQPFRFAGAFYDQQLKLYEMGERWYDPAAGRFLTPDPIPDFDSYLYSDGDPVNLVDRTGASENQWLDLADAAGKPYRHWIVRGGVVMDEQAFGIAQAINRGHLAASAEGMLQSKMLAGPQGVFGRLSSPTTSYSQRSVTMLNKLSDKLVRHVEGLYGRSFSGSGLVNSSTASPASTVTRFIDGELSNAVRVPVTELNPSGTSSRFVRFLKPWGERIANGAGTAWSGASAIAESPVTAGILRTTGRILGSTAGQVGLNLLTSPGSIALDPHEVPIDPSAVELLQRAQAELRAAGLSDQEIEEIWARAGGALGRTDPLRPQTSVVPPSEMEKLAGGSVKDLSPIGPEIRSLAAIRQAQLVRGAINTSASKPGARFAAIADAVDSAMVRRIAADSSVADALLARLSYLVQQAEVLLKNKMLDAAEQFAREAVANLDRLRALLAAAGRPDRTAELDGRANAFLSQIAAARGIVDKALAALDSAKIRAEAGNFGAAHAVIAPVLGDRLLFELVGKPELLEHLEDFDRQVTQAPGLVASIKAELEKMRAAVEKCSMQDWIGAEASAAADFSKFAKFDFHPPDVALLEEQKNKILAESLFAAEKIADLVEKAESLEKTDPNGARTAANAALNLAGTVDAKGQRCALLLATRANALLKRLATTAVSSPVTSVRAVNVLSGSGTIATKDQKINGVISLTIDLTKGTFHGAGSAKSKPWEVPGALTIGKNGHTIQLPSRWETHTETVTLDGRYQGDAEAGALVGTWTRESPDFSSQKKQSASFRAKLDKGTVTGESKFFGAFTLIAQVK